jgi:nucleotide-binding universal stress UspA family protein
MKKILVPIDGSAASKKAAKQAVALARMYGSDVTFLTVVEVSTDLAFSYESDIYYAQFTEFRDNLIKLKTERLGSMLDAVVQMLDCSGIHTDKKVVVGSAHPQVVETAKGGKYDLIVMGHRGLNPFQRLFLGSVAKRVIEDAPCSVLIVK